MNPGGNILIVLVIVVLGDSDKIILALPVGSIVLKAIVEPRFVSIILILFDANDVGRIAFLV